jgi:tRNA uridine 5-carboxymethylaminomethyl modification enzyme
LLRRPDVTYASLMSLPGAGAANVDPVVAEQVEIQIKYDGYIARQHDEIARREKDETTALPLDFDYAAVRGLSREVQQKLNQHKPETIGQASRISGLTPAAISLLLVHLKRGFEARTGRGDAALRAASSNDQEDPREGFLDDRRVERPAA